MGMFDQLKVAGEMMKNMGPDQMKQLMEQAKETQKMLEDTVRKIVDEEIRKRDLISREEIKNILENK